MQIKIFALCANCNYFLSSSIRVHGFRPQTHHWGATEDREASRWLWLDGPDIRMVQAGGTQVEEVQPVKEAPPRAPARDLTPLDAAPPYCSSGHSPALNSNWRNHEEHHATFEAQRRLLDSSANSPP